MSQYLHIAHHAIERWTCACAWMEHYRIRILTLKMAKYDLRKAKRHIYMSNLNGVSGDTFFYYFPFMCCPIYISVLLCLQYKRSSSQMEFH